MFKNEYMHLETYYQSLGEIQRPTLIVWGREDQVWRRKSLYFNLFCLFVLDMQSRECRILFKSDSSCWSISFGCLRSFYSSWQNWRSSKSDNRICSKIMKVSLNDFLLIVFLSEIFWLHKIWLQDRWLKMWEISSETV